MLWLRWGLHKARKLLFLGSETSLMTTKILKDHERLGKLLPGRCSTHSSNANAMRPASRCMSLIYGFNIKACNSIRRPTGPGLQSICICCIGRSFGSEPKGFSNCIAMKF